MDLNLKNKHALITGSGKGIGRAVALALAKEGVKIAVVSRTKSDIDNLLKRIGGHKKGHFGMVLDLVHKEAPSKLIGVVNKEFGIPNIVVHNLGGSLNIKDPLSPAEDWEKVWRFNLGIAIEINNLLIPEMRKNRWGRIVHISSLAGIENTSSLPYGAAKAAINAYVRGLGRVFARDGIVFSGVLPGPIFNKDGHWDKISMKDPKGFKRFITEEMPMGRLGTPEEIANLVAFLCSDNASFCAGSLILVDGGQGRSFFGT